MFSLVTLWLIEFSVPLQPVESGPAVLLPATLLKSNKEMLLWVSLCRHPGKDKITFLLFYGLVWGGVTMKTLGNQPFSFIYWTFSRKPPSTKILVFLTEHWWGILIVGLWSLTERSEDLWFSKIKVWVLHVDATLNLLETEYFF